MKNEVVRIYYDYFYKGETEIKCFGDRSRVTFLTKMWENINPFEHPDGYAVLGEEVIIFEHFEFDSSNNGRKGSEQRRAEAADEKAFRSFVSSEKETVYHGSIAANYTIENYRDNLEKVFASHYREIPRYVKTLQEKGIMTGENRIINLFFIEDTTELGNIFESKTDGSNVLLVLPLCDFFLDLFERSTELDIVIYANCYAKQLWYIDRSMIKEYREQEIETRTIKLFNFNPKSLGIKIPINSTST